MAALGARARVNPRTQPKYVLDAIKAFSADVVERVVHNHSGWVGERYLFANGYVDAGGWHETTDCQLPRRLQGHSLTLGGSMADGLARLDGAVPRPHRGCDTLGVCRAYAGVGDYHCSAGRRTALLHPHAQS